MKILALCDSPTAHTGFGCVARNLFKRWRKSGRVERVDVWGINYDGAPHTLPYRLWPAGSGDWNSPAKLSRFIELLLNGDYTHVWLMQDSFQLSLATVSVAKDGKVIQMPFPEALRLACESKQVKSLLYLPVDAPLDPTWLPIVDAVDVPVAYTEYGRDEVRRAKGEPAIDPRPSSLAPLHVLPHGVETGVFHPLPDRAQLRAECFRGRDGTPWIADTDFLIVNVNQNQPRKGMVQTLQILQSLKAHNATHPRAGGGRFKLYLHCSSEAFHHKMNLYEIGKQLGLLVGEDFLCGDNVFRGNRGLATDESLNQIYNCADLNLSTTLGEGWGLSLTEALAAGCPVAAPDHTSCREIRMEIERLGLTHRMAPLMLRTHGEVAGFDNNRVRHPVCVDSAANTILAWIEHGKFTPRVPLNSAVREWLSWDRIAGEWLELMEQS